MCACSVSVCVSPKITLCYPRNQTTNDNIIAQGFQNTTQKVCCSDINLQQPSNRPLWVLYLSSSFLSARLSHIHPPSQREPPSLGGDQELPVGGALSRSPGSVELTQSC